MSLETHPQDEKILALDLSLTHTGVVFLMYNHKTDRYDALHHATIVPPSHPKGLTSPEWNKMRALRFASAMLGYIDELKPHVIVAEITQHAYPKRKMKDGRTRETTRGEEYKAGYGLGRAVGWLDGVMLHYQMRQYEEMDAGLIKLRIVGNRMASKDAVKDFLKTIFGYDTEGWSEHEVDALACGIAWVRQREGDEKIARARGG